MVPKDVKFLEPFAGGGHLFNYISADWDGYDIQPNHPDVVNRNTIEDFPRGYKVCITNPPYLAKTVVSRKKLPVVLNHEDLYLDALQLCLDNCDYVAAIIPSTFWNQKLFKAMLAKFGVDSPADLDDAKKKEFFNLIDKKHKGVNESKVNESYVVIDPRGNARPAGSKIQADRYVKGKKGHYVILAKNAMKARRAIEKAGGNATSKKIQDLMFDLRYEGKRPDKFKKLVNEAFEGLSNVISAPGIGLNLKTEAAPKMKSSPYASKVMTQMQILSGIEQQMKFKDKNGWDKTKNAFKKAKKVMMDLSGAIRMHGSNLVK